jgi:hypothetical protein
MFWPPLAGHGADPDLAKTERQLAVRALGTVIAAEAAYYASHGQYGTVAELTSGSPQYMDPVFPDTANTGQRFGLALGEEGQSYCAVLLSSAGIVYTASECGLIFAADFDVLAQALLDGGNLPGPQVPFDEY